MGAGKTTLGRALAQQLGWHFIDLDGEVEQHSKCTVSDMFAKFGEPSFRMVEQQVLHNVVLQFQNAASKIKNGIIACGGGAPCYNQNLTFMKATGFVIYLEVSPEILCQRLLTTPSPIRPLLPTNDPQQLLLYIRELLAQRTPYYEAAHWRC